MPKIPIIKRQVAFSDDDGAPFTKCCICDNDEYEDEWIPVICSCQSISSLYAHPFCLENIGKCEGCYDNFERRQQSKTTMTEWPFVENNRRAIYVFIAFTTISLVWDVASCISLDKVDQQELGNTIKSEYIWLPRFHKKQFQVVKIMFFMKLICLFLILFFTRHSRK